MAQMPRGKPRSVPDPVGEQYDHVMGLDRRRREHAELGLAKPWPSLNEMSSGAMPTFIDESDFEAIRRSPPPVPTVSIGGQTYKGVDNVRANVLVPFDPLVSPAELAERRRGVARLGFMSDSPLGSAAYDLAAAMNASPAQRDGALVAGGLVDAAMTGVAPFGIQRRSGVYRPKSEPSTLGLQRLSVRDKGVNERGQAQGKDITVTKSMLGTGTGVNKRVNPPGWRGHGKKFNEGRAHLHGQQLGGGGRTISDLVTLTQNPTNSSHMTKFENEVKRRVRNGEVMEYFVRPLYQDGNLAPSTMMLSAYGSRGEPIGRIIGNPTGRR